MRLHSDFSYVVIAALRTDNRLDGRKYRSIARATVTHDVSDSCTEKSVFVQRIHRMRRRNKAHSGIKNHISHHKTTNEVTRKALYRALKSTVSGCDMHHIAFRYGAYRTTRAAPLPFRFSRMSSRNAFFRLSECCRTHSYSDTLTSATHPVPPGQAPSGRHEKQKSRLHSRLSVDYTITLCIFNYKLSLTPVMQTTPLCGIRLQS